MITYSDDGPDFEPDDPLAVILRPASDYLGPPPGRYEEIRRAAARRRLIRATVGVGVSCVVAALVALPLQSATSDRPASPTVPLAPPVASSSPSPAPTPSVTPRPVSPYPSEQARTDGPATPTSRTTTLPGAPPLTATPEAAGPTDLPEPGR
ncbi:hypothetical protein ACFP51_17310 [Streptomyces pratens]|uniref:Cellulase n=1 Tax=Streptomyces pratens TaxID=887456 RepID=A0ABW1LX09_9ACTN